MKRPLMAAALLLVAAIWIWLAAGGGEKSPFLCQDMSPPEEGVEFYATGQICQIQSDEKKIWIQSVILFPSNASEITYQNTQISCENIPTKIICTDKIICETEEDISKLRLGMQVTVQGTFALFSRSRNPGEFDEYKYYRSLKVCAKLRKTSVIQYRENYWHIRDAAYRLRLLLEERIMTLLPGEEGTVMCALLLGDKSGLDRELKDLYKRNGILHILSISSLHITILGMSLYQLLRRIGVPVIPAALCGAFLLLFYGAMTGFALSAVRAIGMYLLRMLAECLGRTYDMLTALGVLAAVMVSYHPYYLQHVGFLLSFTAVFGVGTIYPVIKPEKKYLGRAAAQEKAYKRYLRLSTEKLRESAAASISITLATLPIQLWFYYEIPLLSMVINLLVLPLVKTLVITGIMSLIPGAGLLSILDVIILRYYEGICRFFDTFTLRTWNPGRPALWQVIVYYLLLALSLLGIAWLRKRSAKRITLSFRNPQKRKAIEITGAYKTEYTAGGKKECVTARAKRIGAVMYERIPIRYGCLLGLLLIFCIPPVKENQVIFLDIGQGNCVLIRNQSGENYLYDCGSSSRSEVGRYVLLPCLKYYGIHRLDSIFLSHPDADHMNGILELPSLMNENRIQLCQLVMSGNHTEETREKYQKVYDAFQQEGGQAVRIAFLKAEDSWNCGDNRYICLHPEEDFSSEDTNAASLCIMGEFPKFRLLLTGDVTGEGEDSLLGAYRNREKELEKDHASKPLILEIPHHGSSHSCSENFLQTVRPAAAVISAGRNNRYGHPHAETLERLEAVQAAVLRTDESGAIIIRTGSRGVEVKRFAQD